MASDEGCGGQEPPSLTRKEFEQIWRANEHTKSPLIHELVRRYNEEILAYHPISQIQLWRLENWRLTPPGRPRKYMAMSPAGTTLNRQRTKDY